MLREELKQLPAGRKDLRKFGLVVGGVFLALAAWFWFRQKWFWPYVAAPGAFLVPMGLVAPMALRRVYLVWLGLALVLGLIVSTVLLTVFYYLVITPIGLAARVAGKDFLSRKFDTGQASFWISKERRTRPAASYEQQF